MYLIGLTHFMKEINLPYIGFTISWSFYDRNDRRYQNYEFNRKPPENIVSDIESILLICQKFELLFPTYYSDRPGNKIYFETDNIVQIIDTLKKKIANNEIEAEISRIGGYGYVYKKDNEKAIQQDLISIDDIRFFERSFRICTRRGCWIPIAIDETYQFNWQITLAKLNSVKLETCLQSIQERLSICVSPGANEIEKEKPIWQKGFKLYATPSLLQREFTNNPPDEPFDLESYLVS